MSNIFGFMFAFGVVISITGVTCQVDELYYDFQEETEPIVTIANISKDSNVSSLLSSTEIPFIRFQLYSGPGSTNFRLNNVTGIISAIARIDRETVCRLQSVCVIRLNVGIQSLQTGSSFFQTITVFVNIADINDNYPVFPRVPTGLSISESAPAGRSYIIAGATDLDTGANHSVQSYSLDPESPVFGIKTQRKLDGGIEVSIVVVASLDREDVADYQLTVVAYDGGNPRKSGEMTLRINITDVNDNTPQFTFTLYNVSVNETASINVSFVSVHADDADANENQQVRYRFSSIQTDYTAVGYFSINDQNGEIYPSKSLTPLQGRTARIVVEAKDGGVDAKIAQCIVQVTVLDNANNPPSIRLNLISENSTVTISETASIGSLVAHFVTSDDDSGQNGDVSCFVRNSTDFSVQQIKLNQYKIILNRGLDREVKPVHHVILVCQDGGQPSLETEVNLLVMVSDENDHAPVFLQDQFYMNITENNKSGFKLITVHATDKDSVHNGEVKYKLGQMSIMTPMIQVNQATGDVIVLGSFDYESEEHVNISIIAWDGGVPSLSDTATIYLTIFDENDNAPYFDDSVYIFNVKENLAPGIFLGKLQGRDDDAGDNGRLNYMLEQNSSLPFKISKDGDLTTTEYLNREQNASYTFRVIAFDLSNSPKYTGVQVTVFVLDENDHTPMITYPNTRNHTIFISYRTVPGTELLQIEAVDNDEGDNSRILYEIKSESKPDYFIIDQNTGSIFLNKQLALIDVGNVTVVVTVADKGVDPKSSTVTFTISITDGNLTLLVTLQDPQQNMLVVIGLVSVTLVVAIVVLTILVLLKRTDKQKQLLQRSQYDMKDISDPDFKKVAQVNSGSMELRKTDIELTGKPFHASQPSNEELIVFKMKLAEKYQVEGGDSSFSKETEMSDVMSSVSGETTGCDSGRGASEGEGHDDGMSSIPNSPRKQLMTFKGPPQMPTYYRLDQIKTGSSTQSSHNNTRHSINLTDSYKMKSGRTSKKQDQYCDKFKINTDNDCGKFRPKSENYDNQKQYLKNVSSNYQYVHSDKTQHNNQYNQQTNTNFNKHGGHVFDKGNSGRLSEKQYRKSNSYHGELSPRNGDISSLQNVDIISNHRNVELVSSLRNSVIYNRDKGMDIDVYSMDTLDDGHSTTTSGSYTVDNDQYTDEIYRDFRFVTHLNHNPEDVFV